MRKSTREAFCNGDKKKHDILEMHYQGVAPSDIDEILLLHRNEARYIISEYWLFDKLHTKR